MEFHISESEDGEMVLELDLEGIEFLIQGLEDLKDCEIGHELQTPSMVDSEEDGIAVSYFVLKRVADTEDLE